MSKPSTNQLDFDVVKRYLLLTLNYWYIIIIGLAIGYSISYYKVRYLVPQYKVDSRIIVKDEYSSWGQEYFLPGMELVSSRNRLINEIGIIKSFSMMKEVVNQLPDLRTTYLDIGKIKTTELYQSSPFSITIIKAENKNKFTKQCFIKLTPKGFHLSIEKDVEQTDKNLKPYNKPFEFDGFTLGLTLNGSFKESYINKTYAFYINPIDFLAKKYQNNIVIDVEDKESSILVLSLTGNHVKKEIDVLNKISEVYIKYGLEEGNKIANNTILFVDEQLEEVHDSLIMAEYRLKGFKNESNNDRIDLEGEQVIPQLTELEKMKLDLEFSQMFYNQTIDYIKNNDDAEGLVIPYFVTRNSSVYDMMNNLIENYSERESIKLSITQENEKWDKINHDIFIQKQMLINNMKSLMDKEKNDIKIIENQIQFLNNKLTQLPEAERQYIILQRDYTINNSLYTFLLQKRSEAAIAEASNIPKAKILDAATEYRSQYVGEKSSDIYTKNLLTFLIAAFGLIFILDLINNKIISRAELEKITAIPVIGEVGHNTYDDNLVLLNNPKSIISESFRTIRANIGYLIKGKEKICIMLSSSVSGEGKTFCSMNLATSYSLLDKKTVLIGADLRKPKIFDDFNLNNEMGLTNYLVHKNTIDDILQPTAHQNLFVITSGPIPPNPSELLASEEMDELIIELKKRFDVIIIDTPPTGLVSDALMLAKHADVNIYVVRQNYTKKGYLRLINEYHEKKDIQNLGIVINDITLKKFGYGYGYGYGYGTYGYGGGYYSEDNKSKNLNIFKKRR